MLTVINIEETPNPNAMKFVVNDVFVPGGDSITYNNPKESGHDPLGQSLFRIRGVTSVFYMHDFVTITKSEDMPWEAIVEDAETVISSTAPVIRVAPPPAEMPAVQVADGVEFDAMTPQERLSKINQILDVEIRPALAGDGGGLHVLGLEGAVLKVHYQGACGSCPTSTEGTLRAIEGRLREMLSGKLVLVAE